MPTDDSEAPVRAVVDATWLVLETSSGRRYINPVRREWSGWSDEELLTEIASAKQDRRT